MRRREQAPEGEAVRKQGIVKNHCAFRPGEYPREVGGGAIMKVLGACLLWLLSAGILWGTPKQARPERQHSSGAQSGACEQQWRAIAQRQRDDAQAMLKEISGYRALLVMLRTDAGTLRDNYIRDGLQVNADMWEKLLGTLQKQAASWQELAQQEEANAHVLCRSGEK